MKPSVLLVDDHRVVAEGLAACLRSTEAYETIGIATSAAEALARAAAERPDVIVMDVRLRNDTEGIEVLRQIRAANPEARVLMLSAYRQPHWVSQALDAGARGYLLKEAPAEEVHRAILKVWHGGDPGAPSSRCGQRLSPREAQVLRMAAAGMRNQEIADSLPKLRAPEAGSITVRAVKDFFDSIFIKLDVDSRVTAIRRARELGYLPPEPEEIRPAERDEQDRGLGR